MKLPRTDRSLAGRQIRTTRACRKDTDHLKEMLFIRDRGEDPSDLILDLIDRFKLEHE